MALAIMRSKVVPLFMGLFCYNRRRTEGAHYAADDLPALYND